MTSDPTGRELALRVLLAEKQYLDGRITAVLDLQTKINAFLVPAVALAAGWVVANRIAGPGTTVLIPQRTCIAVENVGTDTLTNIFIFSSPGFEQVLREASSPEGAQPKRVSPDERAAAFHRGHAEAAPKDC